MLPMQATTIPTSVHAQTLSLFPTSYGHKSTTKTAATIQQHPLVQATCSLPQLTHFSAYPLSLTAKTAATFTSHNFITRPTCAVPPLSANYGLFGNNSLYLESKISLDTLFMQWSSESWGEYLGLAGAVIW